VCEAPCRGGCGKVHSKPPRPEGGPGSGPTKEAMREIPLLIVYPGPVFGWAVACKGGTQSHFFSDRTVAIT
jgi:hypothetical protein